MTTNNDFRSNHETEAERIAAGVAQVAGAQSAQVLPVTTLVPVDRSAAQRESEENSIDLLELFYHLLASWKMILFVVICFSFAAAMITNFLITPLYEASSTIYIVGNRDSAINLSDLQIGAALTDDYVKVFDMWEVHEEVASNLKLNYTDKQLRKMLRVRNDKGTRMLDLIVTSPDPQEAADMANEYARVAIKFIEDTMSTDKPNVMSVALVPLLPVSPSMPKNITLAAVLGLVLCFAVTTIRMLADDKIKTADDIRKYSDLATLAIIPLDDDAQRSDKKQFRKDRKNRKKRGRQSSRRSA